MLLFEWDKDKNIINKKKHKVSFEEASSCFGDCESLTIYDPLHSESEERFILIGVSNKGRILLIAHTKRKNKIRIISARKVTKKERRFYENNG